MRRRWGRGSRSVINPSVASLDLIGHGEVQAVLRRLDTHTLLFVGPPSVGRRCVARWYAALLNCEREAGPCGRCPSCRLFQSDATDAHPDYREIAPETTTKTGKRSRNVQFRIDDLVRRQNGNPDPLGPWLETRPRFRRRVGVIDRAETLNPQAANAFLKFLEEPPSYAVIILIAPSPQAVLPTIASRSTPIRFGTVDVSQIETPIPHPAARLGRAGELIRAAEHAEDFTALTELVNSYVLTLEKGLEEALEKADALEKAWSSETRFSVPELLRARLSDLAPNAYAGAITALERCENALAAYASPGLAVQVLTLELREVVRSSQS